MRWWRGWLGGGNEFDNGNEPVNFREMKAGWIPPMLLATLIVGCGVDPRWGPRNPTNQSIPGSPGVDARWGEPRNGLRDPLEWQYEGLRNGPPGGPK